ncbi:hypothetical protein HJ01_02382 [Flavobacterium frigoris PS1]|uniref:Uncharacterized protein n=1 Tax=Flavobacterium frigoris (strain PS1) TaxID=1086011 RepID=H7FSV1_FLAFP|nr:hypothetical protein HJ01_02382 [Flavobacterium frigoris PS1]
MEDKLIKETKYFFFEIKLPVKNASSFNRKIKSVNGILRVVKINQSF